MTKIAGSGSIIQRHGSGDPDPDPYQNVTDPATLQLAILYDLYLSYEHKGNGYVLSSVCMAK
jgi:hypothetical protein